MNKSYSYNQQPTMNSSESDDTFAFGYGDKSPLVANDIAHLQNSLGMNNKFQGKNLNIETFQGFQRYRAPGRFPQTSTDPNNQARTDPNRHNTATSNESYNMPYQCLNTQPLGYSSNNLAVVTSNILTNFSPENLSLFSVNKGTLKYIPKNQNNPINLNEVRK